MVAARRPAPPVPEKVARVYVQSPKHAQLVAQESVKLRTQEPLERTPVLVASAAPSTIVGKTEPATTPNVTVESATMAVIVKPATPENHAAAAGTTSDVTTITGCLDLDGDTVRLKDTTGANAPKSRSWKTGFLTKRSKSIELVDARGLELSSYAGKRVAAVGTLDDREMHVKSVQVVGPSCR